MKRLDLTVSYGRKNVRDLALAIDIPSTVDEWVSALGEDGLVSVLTAYAAREVEKETQRIMAGSPDLTTSDAEAHFRHLFRFNVDMVRVEKAAKLRAQLAELSAT